MRWYRSSIVVQRILVVILGVFVIAPLLWILVASFKNPVLYIVDNIFIFIDRYVSLEQYREVLFFDLEYWSAYWNTIFLTIPTLALGIGIAAIAAYGLTSIGRRIQNRLLYVYAILSLLPAQMLLIPHLITLSKMNLIGSRMTIILIGSCSPWYVFFLYQLCKQIPKEIFEMARMEGASEWTIFRKIALPQMKSGIITFGIIICADLWGMVEEPVVYIQDSAKYPLPVFFSEMGTEITYAGVVVFALPVVLLFLSGIWEARKQLL